MQNQRRLQVHGGRDGYVSEDVWAFKTTHGCALRNRTATRSKSPKTNSRSPKRTKFADQAGLSGTSSRLRLHRLVTDNDSTSHRPPLPNSSHQKKVMFKFDNQQEQKKSQRTWNNNNRIYPGSLKKSSSNPTIKSTLDDANYSLSKSSLLTE